MTVSILRWPSGLDYKLIDLAIDWRSQSPGKSTTGSEQVTLSQADVWNCRVVFTTLHFNRNEGTVQVPIYRAFIAAVKGRYGVFALPIFDAWYGYGDAFGVGESDAWGGEPFNDDTYWSDGTGFDHSITIPDVAVVDAIAGVSEIVLNFGDYGRILHMGQYFTLNSYLYIVKDIIYDDANGNAYISIEPPLRVGMTSSAIDDVPALFEWPPYLVCRFTEDLTGRHELDFGIFTTPTVEVEEFRER